jgi:hypothetical protein
MSELKSFTHGLFEILLPGSFLLVNIIAFLCIAAGVTVPAQMLPGAEHWGFVEAVPMLGAAYILGMVLRMCRTEIPDRVSALFIAHIWPRIGADDVFVKDVFFYGNWMKERYLPRLPEAATTFFVQFWQPHYLPPERGRSNMNSQFFNFVKTMIQKLDPGMAEQLRNAEAVNRFIGGSFWALAASAVLMAAATVCLYFQRSAVPWAPRLALGTTLAYTLLLGGIARHFRYLRSKEACWVFEASFALRDQLLQLVGKNPLGSPSPAAPPVSPKSSSLPQASISSSP